jgi:hypothetical protein
MAATASHMAASGADTEATAVSRERPYPAMNLQQSKTPRFRKGRAHQEHRDGQDRQY